MTTKDDPYLKAVYGAKDPAQIAAIYDQWAQTYDAEMAKSGYRHPSVALAVLTRHLPRGAAPLLDAGAGTGLVGEWLGLVGYPRVEALDISEGMLAMAALKGNYTALHHLALGDVLPFADGAYAGIISSGVFTTGHVGAEALDELVRICATGGVIVITVKDTLWQAGFSKKLEAWAKTGKIEMLDETQRYASMPGEIDVVPSRVVAFRPL